MVKLVDTKDLKSLPFWECQFGLAEGTIFKMNKPFIISDTNSRSLKLKKQINKIFNKEIIKRSNVVIVIGGDGFMLKTLKKIKILKNHFMELIQVIMDF